jgi:hypothetical protein
VGVRKGVGKGGEMTETMYANMNKIKILKNAALIMGVPLVVRNPLSFQIAEWDNKL